MGGFEESKEGRLMEGSQGNANDGFELSGERSANVKMSM